MSHSQQRNGKLGEPVDSEVHEKDAKNEEQEEEQQILDDAEDVDDDDNEEEEEESDEEEDEETAAIMGDIQELLASENSGYGLDKCFSIALGDCKKELLDGISDPQEGLRNIIEQSLFPIGLAVHPDSNFSDAIQDVMEQIDDDFEAGKIASEEDYASAELDIHADLARHVVDECQLVITGKKRKAKATQQAFANLMDFFAAVRGLDWVTTDAEISRSIFVKLNGAMNGMLNALTDKEVGLIGPKSREFVTKAFESLTSEAAELVGETEKLSEWGIVADGDLPAKRSRKEQEK